jgi:hypothetical protein
VGEVSKRPLHLKSCAQLVPFLLLPALSSGNIGSELVANLIEIN